MPRADVASYQPTAYRRRLLEMEHGFVCRVRTATYPLAYLRARSSPHAARRRHPSLTVLDVCTCAFRSAFVAVSFQSTRAPFAVPVAARAHAHRRAALRAAVPCCVTVVAWRWNSMTPHGLHTWKRKPAVRAARPTRHALPHCAPARRRRGGGAAAARRTPFRNVRLRVARDPALHDRGTLWLTRLRRSRRLTRWRR